NQAVWVQLFHIVNHPTRALCADLLNRVLERLESPSRITTAGKDYLDNPHIPMCPAIARFCAAYAPAIPDWLPGEDRVLMPNRLPMQSPEYLGEVLNQLGQHSSDEINGA